MSWQGRRGKGKGAFTVRCRLDRALANEEWHTLFPCSYTEYLGMVASDHRPVVAFLEDKISRRKGQFRFDKRWVGQEGLMETISMGWSDQSVERKDDIVAKIGNCRHEIARWRKNNPPYGKEKISELQKALEEVQSDDTRSQEDIVEVSRKLQEAYKDEEEYWQQKSRNMWYSSRDLNTKFYHALTKQRRIRNMIVGLYDAVGNWITEDNKVEKVAVDYFHDLFTTTSPSDFDAFLAEVTMGITPQMNQRLLRLATENEVREALFMMHPEKAPGPDGMTALFFQYSWHIIKQDLVEMVLCQRLKGCLPSLISETQSAFVPGRLITDNILIAQEMFHGLRTNKACQGKYMAIKTDMSKAYDRVEWDFIQALLEKMGFDLHWIKLMMECQLINFDKSSIQFGHKIEESVRQELRDILGIQNLGGMGTYLGLPENLGGSKIQVFGFVQDRLNRRVNGWTFKFFTKGGKEVVIKSVVTALPNHVMSCYRLPKATAKKLTNAVARFWWSPGGSTRGMHWKSWDKVIRNLVDPQDVKIIESIPLSRIQRIDRDGWHFTNNGKYSVKSGYQVERVYPDRDKPPEMFGPTVDAQEEFTSARDKW
ncbi:uncharacterized protein LOC125585043 [Brassica napus]|uniref:uncharacterized protein LOC125585043 n=1 Tax=Brassica napus TaxID=3708 RepID=UPI0020786E0C|nr:uncharacterized protein LOC125585043 [Brassica napus]